MEWNLSNSGEIREPIHILYVCEADEHPHSKEIDTKLLIFSRILAMQGFASIYIHDPPSDVPKRNIPGILIFNIDNKSIELPDWLQSIPYEWNFERDLQYNYLPLLQRALTLKLYFEKTDLKCYYFTSFIITPKSKAWPIPAVYKIYPLYKGNKIVIRETCELNPSLCIEYPRIPPIGSFILVPPHEFPYKIISTRDKIIKLKSPLKDDIISIDVTTTKFILISDPPKSLNMFYITEEKAESNDDPRIFRPPHMSTESMEAFYNAVRNKNKSSSEGKSSDEKIPKIPFHEQILSQITNDDNVMSKIRFSFNNCYDLPRTVEETNLQYQGTTVYTLNASPHIFCQSVAPSDIEDKLTPFKGRDANQPYAIVNSAGSNTQKPMSDLISRWQPDGYSPVFGPKDGSYVVFYEKGIPVDSIITFFDQLTHQYSYFGFGKMTLFTQRPGLKEVSEGKALSAALEFYKKDSLVFNREHHVFVYLITKTQESTKLGSDFGYVNFTEHTIMNSTEEDIMMYAFELYAALRSLQDSLKGRIPMIEPRDFFFGFRYQPPFVLSRVDNSISIHIAFNPKNYDSVWVDDTGSAMTRIMIQNNSQLIKNMRMINNQCAENGIPVEFFFTFVAESVQSETVDMIIKDIRESDDPGLYDRTSIFSVYPAPFVQATNITSDVWVSEGHPEIMNPTNDMKTPLSSVIVISRMQSYQVSVFSDNKRSLDKFVQQLCSLSWLTTKPNFSQRTTSLPPHVLKIMMEVDTEISAFTRFIFSPDPSPI